MSFLQHLHNIRANANEREAAALNTAVSSAVTDALDFCALRDEMVQLAAKPGCEVRAFVCVSLGTIPVQHAGALQRLLRGGGGRGPMDVVCKLPAVTRMMDLLGAEFEGVRCRCAAHVGPMGESTLHFWLEAPDMP